MSTLSSEVVEDYVRRIWATSTALRALQWEGPQLAYAIDIDGIYIIVDHPQLDPVAIVAEAIDPIGVGNVVARLALFEATLPARSSEELTALWEKMRGQATLEALREAGYTVPPA